jgi:hypothetical protein
MIPANPAHLVLGGLPPNPGSTELAEVRHLSRSANSMIQETSRCRSGAWMAVRPRSGRASPAQGQTWLWPCAVCGRGPPLPCYWRKAPNARGYGGQRPPSLNTTPLESTQEPDEPQTGIGLPRCRDDRQSWRRKKAGLSGPGADGYGRHSLADSGRRVGRASPLAYSEILWSGEMSCEDARPGWRAGTLALQKPQGLPPYCGHTRANYGVCAGEKARLVRLGLLRFPIWGEGVG